jgi:hypothetical protein
MDVSTAFPCTLGSPSAHLAKLTAAPDERKAAAEGARLGRNATRADIVARFATLENGTELVLAEGMPVELDSRSYRPVP